MAESHKQVTINGEVIDAKTQLLPASRREEFIREIFSQKPWKLDSLSKETDNKFKVSVSTGAIQREYTVFVVTIRDEARQPDEYKSQLGNSYPNYQDNPNTTFVFGVYVTNSESSIQDVLISSFKYGDANLGTNPSLRGVRTEGLLHARRYGFFINSYCSIFRPEFLYYYIENIHNKNLERNDTLPKILKPSDVNYSRYIAAIRTKPFLLLAGISGSGKSRIVRELARSCWPLDSDERKAKKPKNYELIQVKPNWHDSSELIGYVSRIRKDGEKFVYDKFLPFVAKAWENLNTPYFLCLDEMNLAPVEQYFAEYLSVIETRKLVDGSVKTDPLLESNEQWYLDLVHKITTNDDICNQFLKDGIAIPPNLIVVGTVNMDETTFTFSRKVLDRAMTIEMNEVDLEGGLEDSPEDELLIEASQLIGDAAEGKDVYAENKEVCDKVIAFLKKINAVLEGTPFKIGYRARNEFLMYAVNRLMLTDDEDKDFVLNTALDEMTSMKILSRIEGDDQRIKEDLFTGLKKVLKEQFNLDSNDENSTSSISLNKIKEMKDRLKLTGFTSFWS